ncbi:MarR family transcriptional regulator [Actinoplanes sp. NPDC051411]|uniref:MarR family winged helix-turn-helix transcriptional regulator n=1 Tax=Actinoplanes sp. NPDC051411 TaxID=3155522 RepID=UPI0034318C96
MPTPIPERTDRELPLAVLLLETGAIVQEALRAALAGSWLRPRHCQVLLHVAQTGSATQHDLIDAMAVDASVLVGLLNDLESEGLVQRLRDPGDRRRHIVSLSERGSEEQAALRKRIGVMEDALLTDLSAGDRRHARRVLQAIWGRAHS